MKILSRWRCPVGCSAVLLCLALMIAPAPIAADDPYPCEDCTWAGAAPDNPPPPPPDCAYSYNGCG